MDQLEAILAPYFKAWIGMEATYHHTPKLKSVNHKNNTHTYKHMKSSIEYKFLSFEFDTHEIRVMLYTPKPWFVPSSWFFADDVANALGYAYLGNMLDLIPDKDIRVTPDRNYKLLNLDAVELCIFNCDTENAMNFKRWITRECLPGIKEYSSLEAPRTETDKKYSWTQALEIARTIEDIENLIGDKPDVLARLIELAMRDV